jgi:hypothetical protein
LQIPLLQTLPNTTTASREPAWYNLMRRTGEQHVTGQVQVNLGVVRCLCTLALLLRMLLLQTTTC